MDTDLIKSVLATTASASTILQFLTGILVCYKIVRNKSTGDISSFPFVSGWLSTSLWLYYGILTNESSITLTNLVGTTAFFFYVVVFHTYSIKKSVLLRQFFGCAIFLFLVVLYIHHFPEVESAREYLGTTCCIVTVMFFAAPLVSLLHVIRVKNTESLPYPLILSSFFVSLQWFLYGILIDDSFVQIPNFLGSVLSGFQLSLFLIYKGSHGYSNDIV